MVGDIIYMKKNKNSKSLIKKSVFYFILFLIFFELGLYLIFNSFNIGRNENVSYTEEGNVDYSVCLNKNEFYESQCLNKNMSYVAGLIDNIPINFSYNFSFNDDKIIDNLEYEIIGKLVIYSNDTSTSYYEKEYVLKNKTSEGVIKQSDYYSFSDNVDIDYGYYNKIATNFKSQYGVDASSYLEVYLNVYKDSSLKNNISPSKISINIPLSQRSIEIKINSEEINRSQKQTIVNNEFSFSNLSGFIIGIILTLVSFCFFGGILKIFLKLKVKESKYDKLLNKILKEYDRLVVITTTIPNFDDYQIIEINSFNELIDVRDNLRLPIMYYNITSHKKSYFYILHENNLYLYILDSDDFNLKS